MTAGPASALRGSEAGAPQIASSAVVVGRARLGEGSLLAQGAVIRSEDGAVEVGTGSAVLENCVIVANTTIPTIIGRFAAGAEIDGFPAVEVGRMPEPPLTPTWALRRDDLPVPLRAGQGQG
jgi:hypothetical protein